MVISNINLKKLLLDFRIIFFDVLITFINSIKVVIFSI